MLKQLHKIFRGIQGWPEKARRFWAGAMVAMAAVLLLAVWGAVIPSRLQIISAPESAQESENGKPFRGHLSAGEELPPGILESLWRDLRGAWANAGQGLEEIWKYTYEPLK